MRQRTGSSSRRTHSRQRVTPALLVAQAAPGGTTVGANSGSI
jgi:hypothetical protein